MKSLFVVLLLQAVVQDVFAANTCKRDACYRNVSNGPGPRRAQRRADCSAALRKVIDDDSITTIVSTSTVSGPTSYTIATDAPPVLARRGRRQLQQGISGPTNPQITPFPRSGDIDGDMDEMLLFERDKIIAFGEAATYATACENKISYASACLCWGVKAQQYSRSVKKQKYSELWLIHYLALSRHHQ